MQSTSEIMLPQPPFFLAKVAPARKTSQGDIIVPSRFSTGKRSRDTNQQEVVVLCTPKHWPESVEKDFGPMNIKVGDRLAISGFIGPFTINFDTVLLVHIQDILGIIQNASVQVS